MKGRQCGRTRTAVVTTADRLRYPSDLTDEEWALIEPLIPPAKRGGNKRRSIVREVVNGLMYVLSTGCQWRCDPEGPAAAQHGERLFLSWSWDGTLIASTTRSTSMPRAGRTRGQPDRRHHRQPERQERRKRGVVRSTRMAIDAGKKIKGKKRHILVDTQGLLLHALVMRPTSRIATAACW